MGQLQLALFGALPAIVAMAIFDWLDAKRPEPKRTLRMVAFGGMLAAVPVIGLAEVLKLVAPAGYDAATGAATSYVGALYVSFVIAAIPEEGLKQVSMWLFAWRKPEFDERMDGIVYGARAGLGFALVENVAYLLLLPSSMSEYVSIFLGRALLAVPGHATWGAIAGYFAARRRFDGIGPGALGGFVIAALLHGVYDAWVFSVPVAVGAGHLWLLTTVAGIPIVIYAVPTAIVAGGGLWLRELMRKAIAADDHAEAQAPAPRAPRFG